MILGLTIHLLTFTLLGFAIDALFSRWTRVHGAPAWMALWLGLGLLAARLGWLLLPFLNPQPPIALAISSGQRLLAFWWGWLLTIGLALFASWGVVRSWWAIRQLQVFHRENPWSQLAVGSPEFFQAHRLRMHLERQYRHYSKAPNLTVRFSWLTLSPLITGTLRPTLVVPMPLLEDAQGGSLEPLLDHEASHIRMRHHWIYAPLAWLARLVPIFTSLVGSIGWAMVLRVDREIQAKADGAGWNRYLAAIREAIPTQVGWSPALAIPHDSRQAEGRLRLNTEPGPKRGFWPISLILSLFLCGLSASAAVGRVSINHIKEFLMKNQITGYNTRICDPQVQVRALPGLGGRLADGITVDASQATGAFQASLFSVNLRPLLPVNAQAARVAFDYEARRLAGSPGEQALVTSRAMEYAFDEGTRKHHSWIFDCRWQALAAGQGTVSLAMRLQSPERKLAGSVDRLVGPVFVIPAGWRLAITDWRFVVVPSEAVPPNEFPQDVEGLVARVRQGHRPSPLVLDW